MYNSNENLMVTLHITADGMYFILYIIFIYYKLHIILYYINRYFGMEFYMSRYTNNTKFTVFPVFSIFLLSMFTTKSVEKFLNSGYIIYTTIPNQ